MSMKFSDLPKAARDKLRREDEEITYNLSHWYTYRHPRNNFGLIKIPMEKYLTAKNTIELD